MWVCLIITCCSMDWNSCFCPLRIQFAGLFLGDRRRECIAIVFRHPLVLSSQKCPYYPSQAFFFLNYTLIVFFFSYDLPKMYSLPQLLLLPLAFHLVHVRAACPAPLAAVDENPAIVEGDPKCPGGENKFRKLLHQSPGH